MLTVTEGGLCVPQLQMLGYDISWAGFNIIEVMSSAKFTYKRIGYLAASQSFHADTEVKSDLCALSDEVVYDPLGIYSSLG